MPRRKRSAKRRLDRLTWEQEMNLIVGRRSIKVRFIQTDYVHRSPDMDIFPRVSSPRFLLFWWSSRPERCTSSGMSWSAVGIPLSSRSRSWTVRKDCKPTSSTGIWLHWTKMIWVTNGQRPCHTWPPWCHSHCCRVSDRNRPLPQGTDLCWWQKRNRRILHLPGRIIAFIARHVSLEFITESIVAVVDFPHPYIILNIQGWVGGSLISFFCRVGWGSKSKENKYGGCC